MVNSKYHLELLWFGIPNSSASNYEQRGTAMGRGLP